MYMGDEYYEKQISRLERERKIAALAMDSSIAFISFKNDREKIKVRDRVRSLTTSNLDQVTTVRKRLKRDLDKINHSKFISSSNVEDFLENNQKKYQLDLNYQERSRISTVISSNPVEALRQYSMDYISAKRQIDQIKKEQEAAKKESLEDKQRRAQERQQRQERVQNTPMYEPTRNYEPQPRQPIKQVPFQGTNTDESKKLIEEEIDSKISDQFDFYGFSYDERKRIKELYPEFSHYSDYYSVETLEHAISINKIVNKDQIQTEEMMQLGLLTIDVVTNELLHGNDTTRVDLFNKLGVNNSLNKYKNAYNKYRKYYKSLTPEQKQQVETQITNNKKYSELFGNSIATPELMTARINTKVSNYIVDNHMKFYNYKNDFYSKTSHATKYMSIQEIVSLYKRIEFKEQDTGIYATNDEDRLQRENAKREYLEQLQRDFAQVILTRLETHNKHVDYYKMSPEEQQKYLKEVNKKLAAIINDLFKERPLSHSLQEASRGIEEGQGNNLVASYEAKDQAKTQVYGLSGLKKAFAQVTGKWSKYLMLLDKDELSKTEQEEIKGLFR